MLKICPASRGTVKLVEVFPFGFRFGFAVLEAEAIVTSLDDVAMMGKAVELCGGHFGVAEYAGTFAEAEVGGDDAGALVEFGEQVEEQSAAGRAGRQVAEPGFVQCLFLFERVDQIDGGEEPPSQRPDCKNPYRSDNGWPWRRSGRLPAGPCLSRCGPPRSSYCQKSHAGERRQEPRTPGSARRTASHGSAADSPGR